MLIFYRRSFNNNNMRNCYTMGINPSFHGLFPVKVDCIRVTHPCATRHQKQAFMLPFDLHVLSLPLAFILSQDQTLRCNYKFNIVLGLSNITSNEITLRCFSLFLLTSIFSKNFRLTKVKILYLLKGD